MSAPGAISDEMLARYVRGESSPAERETVEAAYFSHESVHERLMALEEELFDEYVRGCLNNEERGRFEALHLWSPEDRQRLSFSRALCRLIDQHPTAKPKEAVESEAILKATGALKPFWPFRWPSSGPFFFKFALPVAFAAILIAAAIIALRTRLWESHAPATKVAATQQKPTTNPPAQTTNPEPSPQQHVTSPQIPAVFAFTLVPSTRDAGSGTKTIRVPMIPATIRLKIALRNTDYARYRASIQKQDGGRKLIVTPHRLSTGSTTLYVDVPSDQLKPGDYVLELWGLVPNQPAEEVAGYAFRVERGR